MPGMGVGGGQRLWPPAPLKCLRALCPGPGSPGACGKTAEANQASFTPAACCLRHLRTAFVTCLLGSTPMEEEARRARILAVLGSRLPRRGVFAEGLADARGQEMTSLATAGGMGKGTTWVAGEAGRGRVLSVPIPGSRCPCRNPQ